MKWPHVNKIKNNIWFDWEASRVCLYNTIVSPWSHTSLFQFYFGWVSRVLPILMVSDLGLMLSECQKL